MAQHGTAEDPYIVSQVTEGEKQFARIDADADGANTVVAAVSAKKIRVLGFALTVSAAANPLAIKSDTTVLAEFDLGANGGIAYPGGDDAPAFETVAGEALVITNPVGVNTNGFLVYREVD